MFGMRYFLLCFFMGSALGAEHMKDLSKRMYIGAAFDYMYMNDSRYLKLAAEEFNMITPGWELKWIHTEPQQGQYTYQEADQIVAFAEKNKMMLRGHTLIWHEEVPDWVYKLDKESLRKAIQTRIINELTRYKGKFYSWDVLNEIFEWNGTIRTTSVFYKNFGEQYIPDALRLARKIDPKTKLYINDYYIENINGKSNDMYNLVKKLKSQGVPIDGVGFQSHFEVGKVAKDFAQNLKRFTDLGLEVALTELDIKIDLPITEEKKKQQADDFAYVYKVCQDNPKCVGVTVWGISDLYSYTRANQGVLWDENFKPKLAVKEVEQVLKKGKKF